MPPRSAIGAAMQILEPLPRPTTPKRARPTSRRQQKSELMARARRAGWKGKSFRKAKRFERMLERIVAENAKLDALAERRAAGLPDVEPVRRSLRSRWRRFFLKGRRRG
jgi:hypothetical protein